MRIYPNPISLRVSETRRVRAGGERECASAPVARIVANAIAVIASLIATFTANPLHFPRASHRHVRSLAETADRPSRGVSPFDSRRPYSPAHLDRSSSIESFGKLFEGEPNTRHPKTHADTLTRDRR